MFCKGTDSRLQTQLLVPRFMGPSTRISFRTESTVHPLRRMLELKSWKRSIPNVETGLGSRGTLETDGC